MMAETIAYIEHIQSTLPDGFVYLDEELGGILWDAKYATEDNFTGAVVDGYEANRIACSVEVMEGLTKAQELAAAEGYTLLIWDSARPQRAVDRFVEWSREPEDGSTKEKHYPNLSKSSLFQNGYIARRSGHSRGCAVDLTLVDAKTGEEIDMGGGFDLMDERSHHGAKGISAEQAENRNVLKNIMQRAGFQSYSAEWWHYSLRDEPYPNTYFDFSITEEAVTDFVAPPPPFEE